MSHREFPGPQWLSGTLSPVVDSLQFHEVCHAVTARPTFEGVTHALLVIAGGRVVYEWYGDGVTHESTLISWSMAKSITHALIGIAVDDGILALTQSHLMPQWESDERADITLHDLLTMRSGLSWNEDYIDGDASDVIRMLFGESDFSGDHAAYAAHQPLIHPPGSTWEYSSGTTNVVARVLANALGEKPGEHRVMEKFMRQRLFESIGMSALPKFDTAGTFVGSSFVYATARDFARFGYLYLADGLWSGQRVLPSQWIHDAQHAMVIDPVTTMGYSTHWWTWPTDADSMIAHGYEGQVMWVSPRRDVLVVHLGKTPADYGALLRQRLHDIVCQFPVLP